MGGLPQLGSGTTRWKGIETTLNKTDRDELSRRAACTVLPSSEKNIVVLDADFLNGAPPWANPDYAQQLEILAQQYLKDLVPAVTWAERVKRHLTRSMVGQRPDLEQVAQHLGVSCRALQRHLHQEHTSFQTLCEEARKELATHYLGQYSVNEVAFLLGYEHPKAFTRAFHRWMGLTPTQFKGASSVGYS